MIFQLTQELSFPHPSLAEESGLLAIGGDLGTERLLLAYANGIFPWYNEGEPICWYAPDPRCVLYPQNVIISKSMQKIFKDRVFSITADKAFAAVISNCKNKERPGQDGTWITDEMKNAYIELHKKGHARSVEVWQKNKLVGGLYGIQMGQLFCGESMFSLVSNASKAALIWLCKNGGYGLIDCQVPTPHLLSMGAEEISLEKYLKILHGEKK
ncbi:MAG: leucyl/phenylalanyl-tRNA--protein transferase [Ferruginibacter sp.]